MRERYAGSDIGAVLSGAELLFISEKLELAYRMYSYDPSGKDSFLLQNSILDYGFFPFDRFCTAPVTDSEDF